MALDPTDPLDLAMIGCLVIGLALMGAGQFYKKRHRHILTACGEVLFGIFWLTLVPEYLEKNDTVYVVFCLAALPAFCLLAYHEYLCFTRKEELVPLDWLAGTAAFSAGLYFLIAFIPPLDEALTYAVAMNTTWVLDLFGYHATLHTGYWIGSEFAVPIEHDGVVRIQIVLACTAIQSIALIMGFILATKPNRGIWEDWAKANLRHVERRIEKSGGIYRLRLVLINGTLKNLLKRSDRGRIGMAVLVTAPVIYVTNLFRNAAVVYVTHEGFLPFDFFHNYLIKAMSFLVLILLFLVLFEILPEFQENVFGFFDIMLRRKKGNVKDGFVVVEQGR